MKRCAAAMACAVWVAVAATGAAAANTLDIYFIDVEGGQSTLIRTPSGGSLLIDAGYAGFGDRDAGRVMAAARDAGLTSIDTLLITHFHGDHDGGVPALARQIPIHTFVDYGRPRETADTTVEPFNAYAAVRSKGAHVQPMPGDRVPLSGADVEVVSAGGALLTKPLSGAGRPNPACASFKPRADDPSENARSVGVRLAFGAFRFLDLGDLNWNPLGRLACPDDLVGPVSVYLVPHHTNSDSNVPALLAALRPRVVVSNNGAEKGGAADALAALHHLAGVDVWQLHRSRAAGASNSDAPLIANIDDGATSDWIKVSASADGSFTV
ncbi:MAG TPA: MBL fold metallo-hydrolase, partial [Vicinamibacterales bacterium]|nr:MBL fold metallo-hydrolase [Vicinamibacterales bacterium]